MISMDACAITKVLTLLQGKQVSSELNLPPSCMTETSVLLLLLAGFSLVDTRATQ